MVFCKLGGEESGSVLDLSEDGLRFESLTPIEEKDLLELRLSVDVNSAIEATGKLAWIDSAKCTGGLRFVDLSPPAREQIRAWLSETSTVPKKRDRQAIDDATTEKPGTLEQTRVPSTQLVPIEQYRKETRAQFLRGVLVGFGICVVVMTPIFFRFTGGTKSGSPPQATASANHAAQSGVEQTRASATPPMSASASILKPAAAKPLATQPSAVVTGSAAVPTGSRQKQSPLMGGVSSTDLMTRASLPPARPQTVKAEPLLGARQAPMATAPGASRVFSPLEPVQNPKKTSATAQQLWSALQAGNMNAAVALADLYTRGEGVPVNCEQARVLLLAAAEKNNAEASKKLQALNRGGCRANRE